MPSATWTKRRKPFLSDQGFWQVFREVVSNSGKCFQFSEVLSAVGSVYNFVEVLINSGKCIFLLILESVSFAPISYRSSQFVK